jgi:hypothetical protein
VIRGRASAVFGPTVFTNQGHERDGAKLLLFELGISLARQFYQGLISFFLAHRNN